MVRAVRSIRLVAGVASLVLVGATGCAAPTEQAATKPSTASTPATPGEGVVGHRPGSRPSGTGTLALDWGDLDRTSAAAIGRGDYVVVQSWEHARLAALHRADPDLRVLMYKDVSAVVREPHESGVFATGVGYAEAERRGWLLTDDRGRRLEWSDWRGLHPVDVGRRDYQDAWLANVLTELRRHPWDGVMLDDTLTTLSHPTVGDRVSTQLPTDRAMYAATESFLRRVGPRLQRAGYLAIPNVTVAWDTWRSTVADWSRHVSGWENEHFVKWGLGRGPRFGGADWRWKARMAAWCARRRVPLLAVTYGSRGRPCRADLSPRDVAADVERRHRREHLRARGTVRQAPPAGRERGTRPARRPAPVGRRWCAPPRVHPRDGAGEPDRPDAAGPRGRPAGPARTADRAAPAGPVSPFGPGAGAPRRTVVLPARAVRARPGW